VDGARFVRNMAAQVTDVTSSQGRPGARGLSTAEEQVLRELTERAVREG
jgi:hypothetical protein